MVKIVSGHTAITTAPALPVYLGQASGGVRSIESFTLWITSREVRRCRARAHELGDLKDPIGVHLVRIGAIAPAHFHKECARL